MSYGKSPKYCNCKRLLDSPVRPVLFIYFPDDKVLENKRLSENQGRVFWLLSCLPTLLFCLIALFPLLLIQDARNDLEFRAFLRVKSSQKTQNTGELAP